MINYQGMLTQTDGTPLDGTYDLGFKIYGSESGTDSLWWEYHSGVEVSNGLFNVILGGINSLDLPFDTLYWLGTRVNTDPELTPRIQLTSVGYAYRAEWADTAVYAQEAETAVSDSDWTVSGSNMYSAVSGNVGIGTSSPTAPLTIQPVNGADIEFGGGAFNADIVADREFRVGTSSSHPLEILTNNQIRLWAGGTGNIGIGTTNPAAKLEVYYDNTNSDSAAIAIDNGTGAPRQDVLDFKFGGVTEARFRKATNGDLYIGTLDNKSIKFQTDETNRMIVSYTGEVGIGTLSPQGALDVNSTSGAFIVPRMTETQRDALTAVNGMIIYNTTTNQFNFYENGAWVTK
jgi:hypothetical protein